METGSRTPALETVLRWIASSPDYKHINDQRTILAAHAELEALKAAPRAPAQGDESR